ncbi:MAG: hypothetical protein WAW69_06225 [Polaromonas sp.]
MNDKQVTVYDTHAAAGKHCDCLHQAEITPEQRQRERDRRRTLMQMPIAAPRYRVMYLKNGKEHQSAWLYHKAHAQQGLAMMRAKYGERNALIYVD